MDNIQIERHKTAIRRNRISRPVSTLLENNLITPETSFFDYGCGHGQDLEILSKNNFQALGGWDPYYRPEAEKKTAEVVNLGYVLNVIENPKERQDTLKKAFELANKVLCVSVMTTIQQGYEGEEFSDGVLSKKKTFQKYFEQSEIKNYIESLLDRDAISVAPGIFYVFKDEIHKLDYLQSKQRSRLFLEVNRLDPLTRETRRVREYKPKLRQLILQHPEFESVLQFISVHGRIPQPEESVAFQQLLTEFKAKRTLINTLMDAIDPEVFESIRQTKKDSLLVFLAMRRFDRAGFPKAQDIPSTMVADIKEHFSSYLDCRKQAEAMLYKIADDKAMSEAMKQIKTGKILPDAVYIHPSFVNSLPPLVQIKVGIAQKLVGDVEECNLIKINKFKPKVSFLIYEDFDTVPHPALKYSLVMELAKNDVKYWEFQNRENPPVLHRKDTFVGEEYPFYQAFKKLTMDEEAAGLLDETASIGTRDGWNNRLKELGFKIENHELIKL
jgi:DNA phosphorothioation-associated putative methyltransferase